MARPDPETTAHEARPDVRGGGVSTDVAECKTAILRPTFRHTNRRLSASCVQWAVGPRWPMPRFRFWCFSTSVSRPTEKVFGFSISKHHQSTDPDGGPFGGCSGTSKTMGKHESPYGNRRFRVSGGAGTRGTGEGPGVGSSRPRGSAFRPAFPVGHNTKRNRRLGARGDSACTTG